MSIRSVRRRLCVLFIVGIAAACFVSALPGAETGKARVFRAGTAKSNITPPLGISIPGGMTDRKATHIHDELHARCLVLDNGDVRVAIVVCDACILDRSAFVRAKELIQKQTGIPPERVIIATTHTHEGGATVSAFQSDADPDYLNWLAIRIADGVRRAINNLRPARFGWGLGKEDRVVFNRRYFLKPGTMPPDPWGHTSDTVKMNPGAGNPNVVKPAGPIDPGLSVVAIQDLDGEPIAVLANYTLHYVGGEKSGDISADYFGIWADMVEREWPKSSNPAKPPFVAILTNGCSGNINNADVRQRVQQPYPYYQMNAVARTVADETLRVLREIKYQDWAPMANGAATVELGTRKPRQQDVQEARRVLEKAAQPLKSLTEIYARETVLLENWPERVTAPVQAIRLGDLGIVTFPGEAFVELGLEVKEKSPFPLTFCMELSNDYLGYIPTVAGHEQGGYETWRARSSFLARDAAPKLVETALHLLKQIRAMP